MSKHWGYVCEGHDPPLESERWLNHGDDALIDLFRKVRSGQWPTAAALVPQFALAYGDELAPMVMVLDSVFLTAHAAPVPPQPGGGAPPWTEPPNWLLLHPRCKVSLRSEYGDRREIGDTVLGEVAPLAVEP